MERTEKRPPRIGEGEGFHEVAQVISVNNHFLRIRNNTITAHCYSNIPIKKLSFLT